MAKVTLLASYNSNDPLTSQQQAKSPQPNSPLSSPSSRASIQMSRPERFSRHSGRNAEFLKEIRRSLECVRRLKKLPAPVPLELAWRTPERKVVVFDLDETLVHCPKCYHQQPNDELWVRIRPYAQQCLEELSNFYEIVIFTASQADYADAVIDLLDPSRTLVAHRLSREHCTSTQGLYVKDLRVLGRSLADVVIVDNSVHAFAYQLNNGIPMLPWYGDSGDTELLELINYLKRLASMNDVRPIIKKSFAFTKRINR